MGCLLFYCTTWYDKRGKKRDVKEERDRDTGRARCRMMFSCSNKVGNITISASSPKDRHKPISKIAPIYLCETVSSSWWQCKLLGWIIPMSFRGVYQNGSIIWGPKFQSALAWTDLHKEASAETAEPGTRTFFKTYSTCLIIKWIFLLIQSNSFGYAVIAHPFGRQEIPTGYLVL